MILAKTLTVTGNTITRAGVSINTIGEEIEKALKAFLSSKEIKEVKKIAQNIEFGQQSKAVVTVLYEGNEAKEKGGLK